MDIVDINKVLDDLEFNEEQRAKLTKSNDHNDRPNAALQNKSPNQNCYVNNHAAAPTIATSPSAPAQLPAPNRTFKKNFVNVSNVFNSLNEYVNAGIDTAKKAGGSVITVSHTHQSTSNQLDDDAGCSSTSIVPTLNAVKNESATIVNTVIASSISAELNQYLHVANATASNATDVTSSTKPECELFVQNQSTNVPNHDVNRDSVTCERLDQEDDQQHQLVDGVEMECRQNDRATRISENDDVVGAGDNEEIGREGEVADQNRENEHETPELSSTTNCLQYNVEAVVEPYETANHTPESPNIHNSVIETRLSNNIIADTVALVDQNQIIDCAAVAESHIGDECNEVTNIEADCHLVGSNKVRPINDDKCDPANTLPQIADSVVVSESTEFIQPISFERAATMDDVSDAELESYLEALEQDMDDAKQCDEIKSLMEMPKSNISMDQTAELLRDDRNADSFSQASTIEFGDGNLDREIQLSASQFSLMNLHTEDEPNMSSTQNDDTLSTVSEVRTFVSATGSNVRSDYDKANNGEVNNQKRPSHLVQNDNSTDSTTSDIRLDISTTSDYSDRSYLPSESSEDPTNIVANTSNGSRHTGNEPNGECTGRINDIDGDDNIDDESNELIPSDDSHMRSDFEDDKEYISDKPGAARPTSLNLYKVYEVAKPPENAGNTPMLLTTATVRSASSEDTHETSSPFTSDGTHETSSQFISASSSTRTDDSNADGNSESSDPILPHSTATLAATSNTQQSANRPTPAPPTHLSNSANISLDNIGKVQPYWIPDNMSLFCMICNVKFTFIKRRHHCRACGLVLCKTCCSLRAKLEYMGDAEARICVQCDILLNKKDDEGLDETASGNEAASGIDSSSNNDINAPSPITRSPNPNNPMEYCSVIPPYQQVAASSSAPISVMVPVGILKRTGSKGQRREKNVMFSDGLRPNVDLDNLDRTWEPRSTNENGESSTVDRKATSRPRNADKLPIIDPKTNSYIPPSRPSTSSEPQDTSLPPICQSTRTEFKYADVENNKQLLNRLENEQLKFMIRRNFYVLVRIVKLTCCINKTVINFTTQGMYLVGQDEIVILLELDSSEHLPKDIFIHLNEIYHDADRGQAITELGFSMASATPFLGSKEHGGFLFIRTTFQCMQNVTVPDNPYLIGILIHRWEVPWAKVFPLRLMLRLGALHRYYPSPHVSVRQRDSVYAEIAQTIINFLADFRTYSYTLPTIRGMYIHMEERRTNVLIPRNRYDQIIKALSNSSDHIIALAANFSKTADGHLVCVQNTESGCAETHAYSTQAINIQGKPRKVTGASFLVLNGALKSTSGLSGKCSIVEDGLMVQILPKKMTAIQQALKTMKDIDIVCGPVDGDETQTEVVAIQWIENDMDFNVGVVSLIDNKPMDGIPSIRVHQGLDFTNSYHAIRWTEVFILKSDEESAHGKDPIDISRLSESIARSTSMAMVPFVDLLASSNQTKFAIRATLDPDQVCYEAASRAEKLGPLYMNSLDSELIPLLHRQATKLQLDQTICLELIFYILDA